jgi:hypothetical protein
MEQILQKITKESEIEILTYSNFFKVFQRIAYKNRDFKLATKF